MKHFFNSITLDFDNIILNYVFIDFLVYLIFIFFNHFLNHDFYHVFVIFNELGEDLFLSNFNLSSLLKNIIS